MEVLHNPVERRRRESTLSASASGSNSYIHVGHVGGMVAWRDQETLIEAIYRARAAGVDARATLVGDGPMRPVLERLIERRSLGGVVRLLGYRSDIGDLLATFDAFVNTAHTEGFGIAVVEAMLAHVPVVVAAGGAHPEFVEEGRTGFLFPPGDVEALARVLMQLHGSPTMRSRIGRAGAASAAERCDPAALAERYAALLASFLNERDTQTSVSGY
jgi:glycosyltransferase involved in cell wall biosynthesis